MNVVDFIIGLGFIAFGIIYFIRAETFTYQFANIVILIVGVCVTIRALLENRRSIV